MKCQIILSSVKSGLVHDSSDVFLDPMFPLPHILDYTVTGLEIVCVCVCVQSKLFWCC